VGELVQNAAHDQWREVIVMAAGHATASQAADLMRRLLARLPGHVTAGQSADRRRGLLARLASMTAGGDESDADRLRLLVAACLQSVVVLPDDVRDLVEAEVKMLMPPRSKSVALTLAQAGDFVLDLLPLPQGESELGPIVETARLIGGRDALAFLIRLAAAAPSEWADLRPALLTAWGDFDADDYARTVLAKLDFTDDKFTLESGDRVASVRFLNLRELTYPGSLGDLIQGGAPEQSFRLHKVTIALAPPPPPRGDSKYKLDARVPSFRVPRAEELDRAIAAVRELKETFIDAQDFESAAACRDQEKQYLALRRHLVPDLHRYLPDLKELELTDYWFEDLSWTPALPKLTQLTLAGLKLRNLRGLPRLDGLISLRICASVVEDSELTPIADACPSLHSLTIDLGGTAAVHLAPLARLGGLKEVIVHDCALVDLSNTTFEDHEVRLLIGPATRAVGTPHGIAIARGIALARSDR
jgi:hypothetical protein